MASVRRIRGGIAPSPYAGVGGNVIRAIAGYAGQPLVLRRNGKDTSAFPFTDHLRFTIAPPGRLPLKSTLFSLVDVPDLRVLTRRWPEVETVWMGAGPVPELLHRLLIALAWLVRLRVVPNLLPLANLMDWAMGNLRWGAHRGGMFVEVEGQGENGTPRRRQWHLLAEGDAGPLIPSMAAEAVVRKVLAGREPAPGARAAIDDLELDDYEPRFARRTIYTGTRDDPGPDAPLYQRMLGDAWYQLPAVIRDLHAIASTRQVDGRCGVERGRGILSRVVAAIFGFPQAGTDVPITVRFDADDRGVETWRRTLGARSWVSRQRAGRGRSEQLLCESFGPLSFAMALVIEGDRLHFVLRRWSAFGLPLPLSLGPRAKAHEAAADGRFHFHVELSHPATGLIVRYQGWLAASAVRPHRPPAQPSP